MTRPATGGEAAFVGSIPENYDRYMAPLFFYGYADDLAARLPATRGMRVLETACGTGVLTQRLLERMGNDSGLVATDLNEAMLARSKKRVPDQPRLERRQADGTSLPFEGRSFDAVVCQFGLMFFPDKAAGIREAFRVLKPGGLYLFNVWDRLEDNPVSLLMHETVTSFFPEDPPQFYRVPFSLHDPAPLSALLKDAGFDDVRWERLDKPGQSPSAADVATGLLEGTPMLGVIQERRPEALAAIREAAIKGIASRFGDGSVHAPMRAIIFQARRSG